METADGDNDVESLESQLTFLFSFIKKMERELADADQQKKQRLLKIIGMGQERLAELRRTFN